MIRIKVGLAVMSVGSMGQALLPVDFQAYCAIQIPILIAVPLSSIANTALIDLIKAVHFQGAMARACLKSAAVGEISRGIHFFSFLYIKKK